MSAYRVRTTSGAEFVWTGDRPELYSQLAAVNFAKYGYAYLECAGGTLVNLAHVESLTPVD